MDNVRKALAVLVEVTRGDPPSEAASEVYVRTLERYPESLVLEAINRCAMELTFFPALAEILARINDGRPGPDEAWARLPKSETDSVVWTDEMREAYGRCRPEIERDRIAGRKAFLECYAKLIARSRAEMVAPKWSVSLGTDKIQRAAAVKEAVERKLIGADSATHLLPAPVSYGEKLDYDKLMELKRMIAGTIRPVDQPHEDHSIETMREQAQRMADRERGDSMAVRKEVGNE